jgi:hypothetical protein
MNRNDTHKRGLKDMKKKQIFILEVNSTQNQSWQGQIEWIQGKKKQSFRSVMELLRLIDSVVCDEDKVTMEDGTPVSDDEDSLRGN